MRPGSNGTRGARRTGRNTAREDNTASRSCQSGPRGSRQRMRAKTASDSPLTPAQPHPTPVAALFSSSLFQWSHGRKAMDTWAFRCQRPDRIHASMGPWPQSHGYAPGAARPCRRSRASMGPWPQSHGYLERLAVEGVDVAASMGPWPQSHGYPWRQVPRDCMSRRFNGAMAAKPWILGRGGRNHV